MSSTTKSNYCTVCCKWFDRINQHFLANPYCKEVFYNHTNNSNNNHRHTAYNLRRPKNNHAISIDVSESSLNPTKTSSRNKMSSLFSSKSKSSTLRMSLDDEDDVFSINNNDTEGNTDDENSNHDYHNTTSSSSHTNNDNSMEYSNNHSSNFSDNYIHASANTFHNNNPVDFTSIADCLRNKTKETISFSRKHLISLKLFQILHRAQASLSLYEELSNFIDNIIPLLASEEKPYIIRRHKLIKDMHSNIMFRGLNVNRTKCNVPDMEVSIHDVNSNKSQINHKIIKRKDEEIPLISQLSNSKYDKNISTLEFSMKPLQTHIVLDQIEQPKMVPTFCFLSSVVSMLQNPHLMTRNNTLYHQDLYLNPLDSVEAAHNNNDYNDIHTSEWFKEAYKEKISYRSQSTSLHFDLASPIPILCPIIFFIDGVTIGNYYNKSLEPVSFTLGLFKRSVRNLPLSWRVLGYIPDCEKSFGIRYNDFKNAAFLKRKHYQQILQHILSQVVSIQSRGGLKWRLPFYDSRDEQPNANDRNTPPTDKDSTKIVWKEVILKFEVMVVIGDMKGNDKLCGRKQTYIASKSKDTGVCRDCNVLFKDAHNFQFKCQFVSSKFLKSLPPKICNRLSFYDMGTLAFDKVSFGADKYGINGNTPPELLHVWYLGVVDFLIEYFLDKITKDGLKFLDKCVMNASQYFARQSDRDMPNIGLFKKGIQKTKLTGREKGDQLFVLYLVFNSSMFKTEVVEIETKTRRRFKILKTNDSPSNRARKKRIEFEKILDSNEKFNKWLRLFEKMISISEFMSSRNCIKKDLLVEDVEVNLFTHDMKDMTSLPSNVDDTQYLLPQVDDLKSAGTVDMHCHFNPDTDEDGQENQHDVDSDNNLNSSDSSSCSSDGSSSSSSCSSTCSSILGDNSENRDENHHEYYYYGRCKKNLTISKLEYALRVFIHDIKSVINKDDHARLMNGKLHQILHLPHYIRKYGHPANIDGSRPEAIGKETGKIPGRRTQNRYDSINLQTATRYYENMCIEFAYCVACETNQYKSTSYHDPWNTEYFMDSYVSRLRDQNQYLQPLDTNNTLHSSRNQQQHNQSECCNIYPNGAIDIYYEYSPHPSRKSRSHHNNVRIQDISVKQIHANKINIELSNLTETDYLEVQCQSRKIYFSSLIQQLFVEKFLSTTQNKTGRIRLYTTITKDDIIFRSSLGYYGSSEWFDWAILSWDENTDNEDYPAKILGIIDAIKFKKWNGTPQQHAGMSIPLTNDDKVWAIIQSTEKPTRTKSNTISSLSTHFKMEGCLRTVNTSSFKETAFVVDDSLNDVNSILDCCKEWNLPSENNPLIRSGNVFCFESRAKWSQIFLNCDLNIL